MPHDDAAVPDIRKFPLRPFLLLGAVSLAAWWLLPGSRIERALLEWCVRGFANPPFFISENDNGWLVRTVNAEPRADLDYAPVLVALDDDPEGVFQTSPPSPIDLAVIFSNLRRLGASDAASAAVFVWDTPDPIGLLALERALGEFDTVTMAAPLGRGAVASMMPPAFRRASVPVSAVHGGADRLPRVNRMILPDAVLGGENVWAGFQFLDNEIPPREMPLLARWEDRVVFAFPLLCAIRQQRVSLEKIEIRLGEFIRLGADGPVLPVDYHGRLAVPVTTRKMDAIPAATLIDAPDDLLSDKKNPFPVLRDDRGAAEPTTRDFSATFPMVMALIGSDAGLAPPHAIRRTSVIFDLVLLAICVGFFTADIRMSDFSQTLVFIGIVAVLCIAQAAGVAMGHWLPGPSVLVALLVAVVIARIPWIWLRRLVPA